MCIESGHNFNEYRNCKLHIFKWNAWVKMFRDVQNTLINLNVFKEFFIRSYNGKSILNVPFVWHTYDSRKTKKNSCASKKSTSCSSCPLSPKYKVFTLTIVRHIVFVNFPELPTLLNVQGFVAKRWAPNSPIPLWSACYLMLVIRVKRSQHSFKHSFLKLCDAVFKTQKPTCKLQHFRFSR